ncbi:MAG: DNA repair protein RecO [Bacteroidetes bacterium]|nr:DNA repair protein RecO [Bacteroidota bacterium]
MSELVKTEALVLRKMDFGDSSKIATLLSPDQGKISVIIKGGRSGKSKIGGVVDTLNHVELVYYSKKSRDIQLVSQADLINNFTGIKENLDSLKYSSAVLELLYILTVSHQEYDRLFRGAIKILKYMNGEQNMSNYYFLKFFIFLLQELGYEFQFDNCTFCGTELIRTRGAKFNFELGMMCDNCSKERIYSYEFSQELFEALICLSRKETETLIKNSFVDNLIYFLERYLMFHIDEFKGLKSLQLI